MTERPDSPSPQAARRREVRLDPRPDPGALGVRPVGEAGRQGFLAWVALAGFLHLAALWTVQRMPRPEQATKPAAATLDAAPFRAAVQASRAQLAAAERPKRAKPKPKAEEPQPRGQIVNLPPSPQAVKPPRDARYLAQYDSQTDRETSSRHKRLDAARAAHELTTARQAAAEDGDRPRAPSGNDGGQQGTGTEHRRGAQTPGAPVAQATSPAKHSPATAAGARRGKGPAAAATAKADPSTAAPPSRVEAVPGSGAADKAMRTPGPEAAPADVDPSAGPRRSLTLEDLVPSIGVLSHIAGAPAPDVLDGVEEGEGTFLNAHAFKYASFYNRLQKQVAGQWKPAEEVRRRDPQGQGLPNSLRATVFVVLDRSGALLDVTVLEASGLAGFDAACVAAFRNAAPFVHPPKGLLDGDGRLSFNFGFLLDFHSPGVFGGDF